MFILHITDQFLLKKTEGLGCIPKPKLQKEVQPNSWKTTSLGGSRTIINLLQNHMLPYNYC